MNSLLRTLTRQIRTLVRRTLVVSVSGEAGKAQTAQVLNEGGAAIDAVEIFEPAGFTSRPPSEAVEGCLLSRSGDGSQSILVCVGARKYRLPVLPGESCMFNTPHGDFVKVKEDRSIEINANLQTDINTPTLNVSGDIVLSGSILVKGDLTVEGESAVEGITSGGANISSTHVHGGVAAGGAVSGAPQ